MPVRIKIKIETNDREIITSALINSGYEADRPEVLIPLRLAQELNLWSPIAEEYVRTPFGIGRMYIICTRAIVQVVTEDRVSSPVRVCVTVSEFEREVLISDYLAGELGIAVEDFREGLWRFRDEPLSKLRKSERPQFWI